jgi:hypothetical protein
LELAHSTSPEKLRGSRPGRLRAADNPGSRAAG